MLLDLVVVGCEFEPDESDYYGEEIEDVANDGVPSSGFDLKVVFLDFL